MDGALIRLKRLLIKTKERGIYWLLKRLYYEILMPSSTFSRILNTFIFFPKNLKNLFFQNSSSSLCFIWDLRIAPITFDILWGIAISKCYQKKNNIRNLHVIIVHKEEGLREEEGDYKEAVSLAQRYWRIENLLISICSLVKNIEYSVLSPEETQKYISNKKLLPENYYVSLPTSVNSDHYKILHRKYDLNIIKIRKQSIYYACKIMNIKKSEKIVTISIRDYGFLKYRNSLLNEWRKTYEFLNKFGLRVVIIPDVESKTDLKKYFSEKDIFCEAQYNNHLKVGIYKRASLNLFVNGGVSTLCIFSDLPYIIFNFIPKYKNGHNFWAANILAERGFAMRERPIFLKKNQFWIWEPDTFENIKPAIINFFQETDKEILKKLNLT